MAMLDSTIEMGQTLIMGLDLHGQGGPLWSFQPPGEQGVPLHAPHGRSSPGQERGQRRPRLVPLCCCETLHLCEYGDSKKCPGAPVPTLRSSRCWGCPGIWGECLWDMAEGEVSQRSYLVSALDHQLCFSPPGATAGSLCLPLVGVGTPHSPWGTPNPPLGSHHPWGPPQSSPRVTLCPPVSPSTP